jgi:hypothetical protein
MSIHKPICDWFVGSGDGATTIEVNIPPAQAIAAVWLNSIEGGGRSFTGIRRYRRRLASGADKSINFGRWDALWPATIEDFISSVTFAISTDDDDQITVALYRIDRWDKPK